MEENKLIESKKILTDYMLELNNDIQRAEDWVNTGADEEMYFALKTVLNELERLQKEFKAVDNECSRLEQKEIILESENEHYKDLIYALETYYTITEEDLEKCVKEDR